MPYGALVMARCSVRVTMAAFEVLRLIQASE